MQKQESIESFSMTFHFVVSFGKELYFSNTQFRRERGQDFFWRQKKVRFGLVKHENAPFSAKKMFLAAGRIVHEMHFAAVLRCFCKFDVSKSEPLLSSVS